MKMKENGKSTKIKIQIVEIFKKTKNKYVKNYPGNVYSFPDLPFFADNLQTYDKIYHRDAN